MKVYRQDRLDADLSSPVEGPGGALFLEGYAARPGIYLYQNEDGSIRRELVPRNRLWDAKSIMSLGRAPLTLNHPPVFVTDENAKDYVHGDVGEEIMEGPGGFVRVRMAARTREAKDAIASGKVQLSPGYIAEIDPTPGVDPEFGEYDAVQISREYNHLAIVDQARGGADIRLRIDSLDWQITEPDMIENENTDMAEQDKMKDAEAEMPAEVPMADAPAEMPAEMPAEGEMAPEGEMPAEGDMPADEPTEEVAPMWFTTWAENFAASMPEMIKAAMDGYMPKKDEQAAMPEPKMDGVDNDRLSWYNERKSLASRADAIGVSYTDTDTNGKIACAVLNSFGIKTENLDERAAVSMAVQMPEGVVKKVDSEAGFGHIVPPTSYGPKRV